MTRRRFLALQLFSAYVTRRRFLASQMFFARSGASAYDDDDDSRVLLRSFLKSILDGISAKGSLLRVVVLASIY